MERSNLRQLASQYKWILALVLFCSVAIAGEYFDRIDVDNIRIDANEVSSTNTNGNITISPNGTGTVIIDTDLDVDNINLNGNTISTTNTDGNLTLTPNGVGSVFVGTTFGVGNLDFDTNTISGTADINITSGASDSVIISPELSVDNLLLNGNTISSTNADGDINLSPNGTGTVVINTDLDVDNINTNGNTVSSTNTNGDIILNPNGTGGVQFVDQTASRAVYLDANQELTSSTTVTNTELEFLDGVTSALCGINQACTETNKTLTTPDINTGINVLAEGYLRLQDTTGGQYAGLKAPGTVSSSYTLVLPNAQGASSETLVNDGSGNLSWGSAGASTSGFAGEAYFNTTTNCTWVVTSTSAAAFATDTDCPGPTIVTENLGDWQTTDANLPQITINDLPAGTYKVTFVFLALSSAGTGARYHVSDGSTTSAGSAGYNVAASSTQVTATGYFTYGSTANRTFSIYGSSVSGSVSVVGTVNPTNIYIERF